MWVQLDRGNMRREGKVFECQKRLGTAAKFKVARIFPKEMSVTVPRIFPQIPGWLKRILGA